MYILHFKFGINVKKQQQQPKIRYQQIRYELQSGFEIKMMQGTDKSDSFIHLFIVSTASGNLDYKHMEI